MPNTRDQTAVITLLGQRIQQRRRERGITQEDLARRARIKPATLSRIENLRLNPGIHTVHTIAGALDSTIGDLVDVKAPALSGRELHLVEMWRALAQDTREALWTIANRLTARQ